MNIPRPQTRILIVDDDPGIRELAQKNLEGIEGTQVAVFEDPWTVLDQCMKFLADGPVIVITDVMMGTDLDGIGLTERLKQFAASRRLSHRLMVIICTAVTIKEGDHQGDHLMQKPFRLHDFRQIVIKYAAQLSDLAHAA